ncbi:HNH endonuclease signature motif containing protein [Serinibacter salmoneus]
MSQLARRESEWCKGSARDFESWRASSSKQGLGVAKAEAAAGQALELLPQVREASSAGEVSEGHLRVIAGVLERSSQGTRERLAAREGEWVQRARSVPVPTFRKELAAQAAAWEADAADRSFEGARARRGLRLMSRSGGVQVEGFLDPVAGATVRTALESLTDAPAVGDERSADARRADALVDLAERTLGLGDRRSGAQIRPHLSVLVREDTWLLLMHRRRRSCGRPGSVGASGPPGASGAADPSAAGASGSAPAAGSAGLAGDGAGRGGLGCRSSEAFGVSGLVAEPPLAQLQDGTLVPFAALEVLACDALVQRVVLDAAGVPLDVGRSERTYEGDLRRAILTRDRHCQFPGCGMRATWCQVHHIWEWSRKGETTLENGITLCSRHHHDVHALGIGITRVRGGFRFTRSNGEVIGQTTRLADELLVPRRRPPGQATRSGADGPDRPDGSAGPGECPPRPDGSGGPGESRPGPDGSGGPGESRPRSDGSGGSGECPPRSDGSGGPGECPPRSDGSGGPGESPPRPDSVAPGRGSPPGPSGQDAVAVTSAGAGATPAQPSLLDI